MLSNITIGQFFPGNSLLHRLDPRVKLVLLLAYIAALFLLDSRAAYVVLTAFALAMMLVSRVPLGTQLRALKPLAWILLFSFAFHLFDAGTPIYTLGPLTLTWEGLEQGIFISLRLVLLMLMSSLLTFTTGPLQLTDAMESLLSPGKRFGLPAHELAMMMTIALRFVPTLLSETERIMKAQQARGADFSSGSIRQRLQAIVPILVPLCLSAFRRADELAMAMEARCYRGGEGRTQLKQLRVSAIDYVCIAVFLVMLLLLVVLAR